MVVRTEISDYPRALVQMLLGADVHESWRAVVYARYDHNAQYLVRVSIVVCPVIEERAERRLIGVKQ